MYIIKKNFKEENSIYLGDYIPMTKIEAQDLTDRLNRNTSDNLLYQFEKMPDFTDWVDSFNFEKNYREGIENYSIYKGKKLIGDISFISENLSCNCIAHFEDEGNEYYKRINKNFSIYKKYTFYNLYRKEDIDLIKDILGTLFINTYISLKTKPDN